LDQDLSGRGGKTEASALELHGVLPNWVGWSRLTISPAGGEQRTNPMVDPDSALMDAAGRGDVDAFEALIRRYQTPLLNFITRYLGDRAGAEDLAQEVFLRMYRAAPRFEPRSKVSTWVFRIAYNLVLTEMDRRKRQARLRESFSQSWREEDREPLDDLGLRRELEEEILGAMGTLPENQRAALLLRVHEELSYREIGEVMGIGVGSVESLLFRARQNLRRSLGKT